MMHLSSFNNTQIVKFPKILDPRGNLTFIQNYDNIPFEIKRVFWIYDVPGGQIRGGHAYKELYEVIIALSGSFDVIINNGKDEKKFSLNRSYYGLLVPNMIWRQLENFSTNSLSLILASNEYDESDYIRNFKEYQKLLYG